MNNLSLMIPGLLLINGMTYFLYWWDKRQARFRGARVPEMMLLLLGAIGGSPAAFIAQRRLRHKTRKQPFKTIVWGIVLVQVYCLFVYLAPPPAI